MNPYVEVELRDPALCAGRWEALDARSDIALEFCGEELLQVLGLAPFRKLDQPLQDLGGGFATILISRDGHYCNSERISELLLCIPQLLP